MTEKEPIFFDFETDTGGRVYLLAVRIDDRTIQYACDPELVSIGKQHALKITDPETACEKLLSLKDKKGRWLACYSSHDGTVLRAVIPTLSDTYLDMHKLAKSWINQYHYD